MALSRKRASLLPLQEELRALHIPAQIGEKTELIDCCEVLDVVALLDVLVSPQHDLSLARALRSPLFNLSDDALVQIALAKSDSKQSWFEVLFNEELLAPELIGLGATLTSYKALVDRLPPHDALQAIYSQGDVLELRLIRNPDILKSLAEHRMPGQLIVGFAAGRGSLDGSTDAATATEIARTLARQRGGE